MVSDQTRLRWRHRLQELDAKHGRVSDQPMDDWLDHYPEPTRRPAERAESASTPRRNPPPDAAGGVASPQPLEFGGAPRRPLSVDDLDL